jgi:imidazolonepropionase-like amidohydrolase
MASKTTILKGATVIDGTGQTALPNAAVVLTDGKVRSVSQGSPPDDPQAAVIDVTGQYILPGLIDCHVHLALDGSPEGDLSGGLGTTMLHMLKHAQESLRSGFTTLRDAGGRAHLEFQLRKAIDSGLWCGPRLMLAGKLLSITSSGTEFIDGMYREADGMEEVRKATREQLKAGADFIKVMATGAVMAPGEDPKSTQYNVEEMRTAVEEAQKRGKYVAAHAHAAQGIANAVEAGVRTIEHGTFLCENEKLMQAMSDKGMFLVPTLKVFRDMTRDDHTGIPAWMQEKAKRIAEKHRLSIQKAINHGVRIAMGTDACTPYNYHGDNAIELQLMAECGMTTMQAIMSATSRAAEALGLAEELGTLEPGKIADLIVVKKNPLENLAHLRRENIAMVIKDGIVVAHPCDCGIQSSPEQVIAKNWLCCGFPL